jgi:tetratricopeptide (TPR) repeat protein
LLLLLIAGIGAAAFYGGMYFQRQRAESPPQAAATPTPQPTPVDTIREFEDKRQQVDKDPANMAKTLRETATAKGVQNPLDSSDPEFLYLYGRALMLMGDNQNAMPAFERAIVTLKANTSPLHDKLRVEARVAALAVALRLRRLQPGAEQRAISAFDELINQGSGQLESPQ